MPVLSLPFNYQFGLAFADANENLSSGLWHGPVKSAYGLHAIYVHDRVDKALPDVYDVIDQVRTDWMFTNQEVNTRKVYGKIRSKYRVLVEGLTHVF